MLFWQTLEEVQQSLHFHRVKDSQEALKNTVADALDIGENELAAITPEPAFAETYQDLLTAFHHAKLAYTTFDEGEVFPDFGMSYVKSRGMRCRALELIYKRRAQLPILDEFFLLRDQARNNDQARAADARKADGEPLGLSHYHATADHHNYSLYVPEYYDASEQWPLIITLHGGYGRGDEYIWSWLRIALSAGYVPLSPKSLGMTWSIAQPTFDGRSILNMLEVVSARYAIDPARVYPTAQHLVYCLVSHRHCHSRNNHWGFVEH